MYGIPLISGHNDCYWNVRGICTYHKYDPTKRYKHNFDSKENCTVTQLGTQVCSNYKKEPL